MTETPPVTPVTDDDRRCGMCGYHLTGMGPRGICPECGSSYSPDELLQQWPSAGRICWQLGWPILGVVLGAAMLGAGTGGPEVLIGIVTLWAMLVAIPVNSYFRVRRLLKNSLPENIRKRGLVAVLRGVGTTLCIVLFIAFFGVPLACVGVCLFQV